LAVFALADLFATEQTEAGNFSHMNALSYYADSEDSRENRRFS
jgi:hypothetical protein